MTKSTIPIIPFSNYNGGRFTYLLKEPFAAQLWHYLSRRDNIAQMIDASVQGKAAVSPLLPTIEEKFGSFITTDQFPDDDVAVMVNNMVLQIMNTIGYDHIACGMLPHGRLIKLSGVYKKRSTHPKVCVPG